MSAGDVPFTDVPYNSNSIAPGHSHFLIRGWDSGTVYADVQCVCGKALYDDEVPLSNTGEIVLVCRRCGRRYAIKVFCTMSGGPMDG